MASSGSNERTFFIIVIVVVVVVVVVIVVFVGLAIRSCRLLCCAPQITGPLLSWSVWLRCFFDGLDEQYLG